MDGLKGEQGEFEALLDWEPVGILQDGGDDTSFGPVGVHGGTFWGG